MSSIGWALETEHVASYSKKTTLSAVNITAKMFYLPFITNKTERISSVSGSVVWVAKHLKGDWFIVLHLQLWLEITLYWMYLLVY